MDWSKGFSAAYYMETVDPVTWRDRQRIEITGGSVSRSSSGLRQSADVTCTEFQPDTELWIRIYLEASQGGETERAALFTGLASVPDTEISGTLRRYPLACYSVLKPLEDVILQRGYYVLAGTDCASALRDLLAATPAPAVIEGQAPTLYQTIIAEGGETPLSMAGRILDAIGWRMRIDGDGTIRIGPRGETETAAFGIYNDVIEPQLKLRSDWFSCPNVFRATSGDLTATARDDSPDSPLSTVRRGREVWMAEDSVKLAEGEGLQQYAERRLLEEQARAGSVQYTRRFDPAVNVTDKVRLHYPPQGLMGLYTVSSQSITLGAGAAVSEEVRR